jgi:DNA-directed RNA polymerase subunit beta'
MYDKEGRELERHTTMVGSHIFIEDGQKVKKGQAFMKWDPHNVPIISEHTGRIKFHDFIEGVTIRKEQDAQTGLENTVVLEHKEDLHPQIIVVDPKDGESTLNAYAIPSGAQVTVEEGVDVTAGMIVAKTPRKAARTNDITGGLPRVAAAHRRSRGSAGIVGSVRTPRAAGISGKPGAIRVPCTGRGN